MRVEGSYTVESALIVPIVLGCILLILNQTIELYIEVTDSTVYSEWWQEFEPEASFRKIEFLRVMGEEREEE